MNELETKIKLLNSLGREIARVGQEVYKKHGSYWVLQIQSGIIFTHDDYNGVVIAYYPDGTHFYFGMNFGRMYEHDFKNVSILHLQSTIDLVKTEPKKIMDSEKAMRYVYYR